MSVSFERAADYVFDRSNSDQIVADFDAYFRSYTGRFFEEFVARSNPDRFTCEDLGAAASLSVPLSGDTVVDLLIGRANHFNSLLSATNMPGAGEDLRTVDADALSPASPLTKLYEALKTLPDVSYVRASKLLATKRPALVPIRDSVVEAFLGAGTAWWQPYRDLVNVDGFAERVFDLSSGVPDRVTLLRRIDVALWMAGKRQGL